MSSVASEEDFACIPGLGENKQKPRKYMFAIDPCFRLGSILAPWEAPSKCPLTSDKFEK